MTTDISKSKFIDYRILVQLCKCGHKENSHQYGLCYGDFMTSSCPCAKFELSISQMEFDRISEILNSNTWEKTE